MWEISRDARVAIGLFVAFASLSVESHAQDTFINQNISGFNLPGVQLPQGHDEVRAADGTTCRSAVSGSGAYLDIGVIGNPEQTTNSGSFSAYGRVVVPIGRKAKRLDCTQLYDLEVQRLAMELKLMQMGLSRGIAPVADGSAEDDGWGSDNPVAEADAGQPEEDVIEMPESMKKLKPMKLAKKQPSEDDWAEDGWSTDGLKD